MKRNDIHWKIWPVNGSTKYGPGGILAAREMPFMKESEVMTIELVCPAVKLVDGDPEPLKARYTPIQGIQTLIRNQADRLLHTVKEERVPYII